MMIKKKRIYLEKIINENFPEYKLIFTDNGYEATYYYFQAKFLL